MKQGIPPCGLLSALERRPECRIGDIERVEAIAGPRVPVDSIRHL
jgi:hypothetical protein